MNIVLFVVSMACALGALGFAANRVLNDGTLSNDDKAMMFEGVANSLNPIA